MNVLLKSVFALSLLPLLAHAVDAVTLSPIPTQYLIPKVAEQIRIDGDLNDWDFDQAIVVEPTGQPTDQLLLPPGHQFEGAADLSSEVMLAWDEQFLYIAARTRDNHLRGMAPGTGHAEGPAGWACDSVMLVLHSFRQPLYRPGPHLPIALRYTVPEDGRGELLDYKRGTPDQTHLSWKLPRNSLFACIETDDGYQVEAAVPWAELNFTAVAGEPLDIAILLADIDPGKPLKQLGWEFPHRARFRLADEHGALGLLTIAREQLIAGKEPQAIRYQVDALDADIQIEAIRILGAEGLHRLEPVNVAVPQGQRAEGLLVIHDLPPNVGPAIVSLEISKAGETVILTQADFRIAAAEPTSPLVSNPPGEIIRQSPERTHHHAREDRRLHKIRYNYIKDRSGYERYLLTHVQNSMDATGGNIDSFMGDHGHIWAGSHVLPALALYRLTGEQKYADWTKMLIEAQLRYLETEENFERRLTRLNSLIWPRYLIWQNDPHTPLAPADAEERYARTWAAIAANPPEIATSEWGYHNRCWHRWHWAKLMIHFAQKVSGEIAPELHEYVRWHDENLVPLGNSTDNSGGYNWLTPAYFLSTMAALDQLDEALENKGMLSTVARLRDHFAPNGVIPNWGDTSGWMTGAAAGMEHMELLSGLTDDGSFRYVGQRTAEYFYNFMWQNPDQYHMVKDSVAHAFVKAWLFADDSVAPRGATAASIITQTNRTVELSAEEKDARPGLAFGRLSAEQTVDKAILKSGNNPFGLWAFVELLDSGGHAGILPGNIATILHESTVLYGGQGYWDTGQGDNNVVWVEDMEGVAAVGPMRSEVPAFVEDPALTWLQVRTLNYGDLPITSTRDILFVKNGAIVVRDKLTFHATMKLRFGPCWHTRRLGPQSGDDWFNTYYEKLYATGLGIGRGVHAYPNPAWDMLVAYAPRDDYTITVTDRYDDNPWRVSPLRLRQWWSGIVRSGEVRTFVSVLLPHVPTFDVAIFREHIDFTVDTADALLVRLPRCDNPRNPLSGNRITLQLQDGSRNIESDGWSSDARVAMVERKPDGQLQHAVVIDGNRLNDDGDDLLASARRPELKVVQLHQPAEQ